MEEFIIEKGVLLEYTGSGGRVSIPEDVTNIGDQAFLNCEGLTEVTIPEGVTRIGNDAFGGCKKLDSITIPESVTVIGFNAFLDCESLTSLTIPKRATEIGDAAFSGCKGLVSLEIPESILKISDKMFCNCNGLTRFTIPEGVAEIGARAFSRCSGLTEIEIPETVTKIGDYAFMDCRSLVELKIPENVTEIGAAAFCGCTNLSSVILPNGITKISGDLFRNCPRLTELKIPESVMEIGDSAFAHCENLTGITIPDSVTRIDRHAFFYCSALADLTLPKGLKSIGDDAFCKCEHLTEIHIPEGVTEIGPDAFSGCTGLTRLALPELVKEIGRHAFSGCTGLTSVTLPNGITEISSSLFSDCTGLTVVNIPEGVAEIKGGAFMKCTSLTSVTLPGTLREIEGLAFYDCKALESIQIPEGVKTIRDFAFDGCKKLVRVDLPASLTDLEKNAFVRCPRVILAALGQNPDKKMFSNEQKVLLALGYCVNPSLYTKKAIADQYKKYAENHKKEILEAAEKRPVAVKKAVRAYYGVEPVKRGKGAPVNSYAKLSAQRKVLLLEETVLSGDMEKLEEVIKGCKTFEFTARALGLACRFGSLAMVQRLAKAKATFRYSRLDSSLKSKYDTYTVYYGFSKKTVYHQFAYMITADTLFDQDTFGDLRGIREHISVDGQERPAIPEEERIAILRWLIHRESAKPDCGWEEILWTVFVEEKQSFVDAMLEEQVKFNHFHYTTFSGGMPLGELPLEKKYQFIPQILDIMAAQNNKFQASLALIQSVQEKPELVRRLLDEAKLPEKMDTTKLLKGSLNAANTGTLVICLERGYLKSIATREKLIEQALKEGKSEHAAVLMDYKNRTADLAKEAAAQEAKDLKFLNADPNSAYIMKQTWRYEKQEDGSIRITGYKGTGGDVYVPEIIGKNPVMVIGANAFSPFASGLTKAVREGRDKIKSVTIPQGITSIEGYAFFCCNNLESVTLPEGLKQLGVHAFGDCAALKSITIPTGIKKLEEMVFQNCTTLTKVHLPDGLLSIEELAFDNCRALTAVDLPKSVRKIEAGAFDACQSLSKIVIPKGVKTLKPYTFQECLALEEITIPESVTEISGWIFRGNGTPGLIIYGVPGSEAEKFATIIRKRFRPLEE